MIRDFSLLDLFESKLTDFSKDFELSAGNVFEVQGSTTNLTFIDF